MVPVLASVILLVKVKVTQSCPTLCDPSDPMDYTVHGILQAPGKYQLELPSG